MEFGGLPHSCRKNKLLAQAAGSGEDLPAGSGLNYSLRLEYQEGITQREIEVAVETGSNNAQCRFNL